MNRISNGFKKVLAAAVVLCCCVAASFADNPVKGKTYIADMMGIDMFSLAFTSDTECVMTALIDETGSPANEKVYGTYKATGSSVTVTLEGDSMTFPYNASADVLTMEMGEGFTIQLKVKKEVASNPNAKAPSTLNGRTYVGNILGIEFMTIEFTSDKNCVVKVAGDIDDNGKPSYESVKGTYEYSSKDKNVKITIEGETMDFIYDASRNTLGIVEPNSGLTVQLEQK